MWWIVDEETKGWIRWELGSWQLQWYYCSFAGVVRQRTCEEYWWRQTENWFTSFFLTIIPSKAASLLHFPGEACVKENRNRTYVDTLYHIKEIKRLFAKVAWNWQLTRADMVTAAPLWTSPIPAGPAGLCAGAQGRAQPCPDALSRFKYADVCRQKTTKWRHNWRATEAIYFRVFLALRQSSRRSSPWECLSYFQKSTCTPERVFPICSRTDFKQELQSP